LVLSSRHRFFVRCPGAIPYYRWVASTALIVGGFLGPFGPKVGPRAQKLWAPCRSEARLRGVWEVFVAVTYGALDIILAQSQGLNPSVVRPVLSSTAVRGKTPVGYFFPEAGPSRRCFFPSTPLRPPAASACGPRSGARLKAGAVLYRDVCGQLSRVSQDMPGREFAAGAGARTPQDA